MEDPRFTQVRHTFSMECAVEVTIRATATVVWTILVALASGSTGIQAATVAGRSLDSLQPGGAG